MHLWLQPPPELTSERLDLGVLEWPEWSHRMGNSKTTYDKKVQKDKERIKAKATGRKLSGQADPSSAANLPEPALYASTRNWIRRSNLHCYNVYCCDRAVWVSAIIESISLDCKTGKTVIEFHECDAESVFFTCCVPQRLLGEIDTLLTLYMQECGSEMQRLFDRIRSAFIDLYALHMLPELKETGTVPPTYNVWLLNQQRRERLEEAVASAKQVAECIGMAAMGIMDPEVNRWLASVNHFQLRSWVDNITEDDPLRLVDELLEYDSVAPESDVMSQTALQQLARQASSTSPEKRHSSSSSFSHRAPSPLSPPGLACEATDQPMSAAALIACAEEEATTRSWHGDAAADADIDEAELDRYELAALDSRLALLLHPDLRRRGLVVSDTDMLAQIEAEDTVIQDCIVVVRQLEREIASELQEEMQRVRDMLPAALLSNTPESPKGAGTGSGNGRTSADQTKARRSAAKIWAKARAKEQREKQAFAALVKRIERQEEGGAHLRHRVKVPSTLRLVTSMAQLDAKEQRAPSVKPEETRGVISVKQPKSAADRALEEEAGSVVAAAGKKRRKKRKSPTRQEGQIGRKRKRTSDGSSTDDWADPSAKEPQPKKQKRSIPSTVSLSPRKKATVTFTFKGGNAAALLPSPQITSPPNVLLSQNVLGYGNKAGPSGPTLSSFPGRTPSHTNPVTRRPTINLFAPPPSSPPPHHSMISSSGSSPRSATFSSPTLSSISLASSPLSDTNDESDANDFEPGWEIQTYQGARQRQQSGQTRGQGQRSMQRPLTSTVRPALTRNGSFADLRLGAASPHDRHVADEEGENWQDVVDVGKGYHSGSGSETESDEESDDDEEEAEEDEMEVDDEDEVDPRIVADDEDEEESDEEVDDLEEFDIADASAQQEDDEEVNSSYEKAEKGARGDRYPQKKQEEEGIDRQNDADQEDGIDEEPDSRMPSPMPRKRWGRLGRLSYRKDRRAAVVQQEQQHEEEEAAAEEDRHEEEEDESSSDDELEELAVQRDLIAFPGSCALHSGCISGYPTSQDVPVVQVQQKHSEETEELLDDALMHLLNGIGGADPAVLGSGQPVNLDKEEEEWALGLIGQAVGSPLHCALEAAEQTGTDRANAVLVRDDPNIEQAGTPVGKGPAFDHYASRMRYPGTLGAPGERLRPPAIAVPQQRQQQAWFRGPGNTIDSRDFLSSGRTSRRGWATSNARESLSDEGTAGRAADEAAGVQDTGEVVLGQDDLRALVGDDSGFQESNSHDIPVPQLDFSPPRSSIVKRTYGGSFEIKSSASPGEHRQSLAQSNPPGEPGALQPVSPTRRRFHEDTPEPDGRAGSQQLSINSFLDSLVSTSAC